MLGGSVPEPAGDGPPPGAVMHAGASFPRARMAKETKLTKNRQERHSLQHELLAFSGFAGLRLFAAFVKRQGMLLLPHR